MSNDASWTCHRSFDGALVRLDFVLSCSRMTLVRSWCDHCMSVGLDLRCVHCILAFMSRRLRQLCDCETDAQLDAEIGQHRPTFFFFPEFFLFSHIAHFGAKSKKYRFENETVGVSFNPLQCYLPRMFADDAFSNLVASFLQNLSAPRRPGSPQTNLGFRSAESGSGNG